MGVGYVSHNELRPLRCAHKVGCASWCVVRGVDGIIAENVEHTIKMVGVAWGRIAIRAVDQSLLISCWLCPVQTCE